MRSEDRYRKIFDPARFELAMETVIEINNLSKDYVTGFLRKKKVRARPTPACERGKCMLVPHQRAEHASINLATGEAVRQRAKHQKRAEHASITLATGEPVSAEPVDEHPRIA